MVYFITCEDKVKIGVSSDPERRRKQLTLPETKVVATMIGDRATERQLHWRFRRARIGRSEWFWKLPEIVQFIGELNAQEV